MPKLKKMRLSKDLPGVNFYRKDKFAFVFHNIGLDAKRMVKDPAFIPTWQQAESFASKARLAGHIHNILFPQAARWKGNNCFRHLVTCLVKQTELSSFTCNPSAFPQNPFFNFGYIEYPDAQTKCIITVPSFIPVHKIYAPLGATHFRLGLRLLSINKITGKIITAENDPPLFYRMDCTPTRKRELDLRVRHISGIIKIASVDISFYHATDHDTYTFNNGKSNNTFITLISP